MMIAFLHGKNRDLLLLVVLFLLGVPAQAQTVSSWVTNASASQKLTPQPAFSFSPDNGSGGIIITIDGQTTYQTMDGFGAAMTGSSAYVFNTKLNATARGALFDDLFTSSGIRLSMVRHTIGASDFNLTSYTYNDLPPGQTDPSLSQFSIAYDQTDIIPMLQLARQKNSALRIMGSAWSAPAWMKEVHNLNGGWLDVQWYKTYADYLVKYIQAYTAQSLPIWAITLQNEPLHETSSYPSMRMDAGNQISFLKNDIGPAFANAGLSTKLIVYDHNWDRPDYPIEVLNDPQARAYAAGSAFHAYAGQVSAQTTVHDAHPDKDIWFTEISGGDWSTNWGSNLAWNMNNIIIGATRNWAKGVLLWNLALDENHGPTNGGCNNCRGVVTINSQTGAVTKEVEYYVLGHISKFVDPGAVRISSTSNTTINNVAFKNPDGSIVLIAFNNSGRPTQSFKVMQGTQSFSYTLEKGAAITFKWTPTTGGGGNATSMHVASITTGTVSTGGGNKRGQATVTIHNNLGQPAPSATVTGTFSGTFTETVSGATDANGRANLVTSATAKGTVTVNFCVSNVSHATLAYAPAQNQVTCSSGSALQTADIKANAGHAPEVVVYPNPATPGELYIRLNTNAVFPVRAILSTLSGQVILSLSPREEVTKVPLPEDLPRGLYLLQVETSNGVFTEKIDIK